MDKDDRISIEELLGHQDWVLNLARGLVGRGDAAEDLAQDTWMAALANPPRNSRNLKAWFAGVLRHAMGQEARGRRRRERREESASSPDPLPSPEDILEREDLRRHVIRELMRLDEATRDVLLLKFYAGLSPKRIAETLDVPLATARTRSQRGLELLRDRLDQHYGDRGRWCSVMVLMAGIPASPAVWSTTSLVSNVGFWKTGGVAVSTTLKLLLGFLGLIIVCLSVFFWLDFSGAKDEIESGVPVVEEETREARRSRAPESKDSKNASVDPESVPVSQGPGAEIQRVQPFEGRLSFAGRVTDKNGREIVGARVTAAAAEELGVSNLRDFYSNSDFRRLRGGSESQVVALTDDEGRYTLDVPQFKGAATLAAWHEDHGLGVAVRQAVKGSGEVSVVDLTIDTGIVVHGEIKDKDGRPIPGSYVSTMVETKPERFSSGMGMTAEPDGSYRTPRLSFSRIHIQIGAPGYVDAASGWLGEPGGPREIRFDAVLEKLPKLDGRLVRPDGRPAIWSEIISQRFSGQAIGDYMLTNRTRLFATYRAIENDKSFLANAHGGGDVDTVDARYSITLNKSDRFLYLFVGDRRVAEAKLDESGRAPDLVVNIENFPAPVVRRSLKVEVQRLDGAAVEGFSWTLTRTEYTENRYRSLRNKVVGNRTTIDNLKLGSWRLAIQVEGCGRTYRDFELIAGDSPHSLKVTPAIADSAVRVQVVDELGRGLEKVQALLFDAQGCAVELKRGHYTQSDSEGHVRIDGLVAGEYTLSATADGFSAGAVKVKAVARPDPVRLQMTRGVEVTVNFVGCSGPIMLRVFEAEGQKLRDDNEVLTRLFGAERILRLRKDVSYRIEGLAPGFQIASRTLRAEEGLSVELEFKP